MRKSNLKGHLALALLCSALIFTGAAIASPVIGYNGSVTEKGSNIEFKGWTCQAGVPQSLKVHIYVGGAAGKGGTFIGSGTANVSHEQGVTDRCGNTIPHRYVINIDESKLVAHKGKGVYAHGISVVQGYGNSALTNGGKYTIPYFTRQLKISQLVKTGNDTIIEDDMEVTIDANHATRVLDIKGKLICPTTGSYAVRAKAIAVEGEIQCGTPSAPVTGSIKFRLRGEYSLKRNMMHDGMMMNHDMGIKAFAVLNGGSVKMYGSQSRSQWTYLSNTAIAGVDTIKLAHAVNWNKGDLISIAPTDFDFKEAEEAVILKKISDQEYQLDRQLKYAHYGKNKKYTKGSLELTLKSRAEVGNLSRNIIIETEEDVSQSSLGDLQYIGAHMMVAHGGHAEIDAVEFRYMGQMGRMAKYPFHWHQAGDVTGQFIKNSSIHHSFQRCVTIHGTNWATVENNICYDHRGHGIFLEDGSEIKNTIISNLLILTRRPELDRILLESDHVKRNLKAGQTESQRENSTGNNGKRHVGPSSYWIANPNNKVSGNVSAGSEGTGFWMSFEERQKCNPDACTTPSKQNTWVFNGNVARSNLVGMTWEGAQSTKSAGNPLNPDDMTIEAVVYSPKKIPTFKNNRIMKSARAAIYSRSTTMNFDQTITADSTWHHFHAFNVRIKNSILVGWGPNQTSKSRGVIASNAGAHGAAGMILYDGPFELDNVLFADFSKSDETVSSTDKRDVTLKGMKTIFGAAKYVNRSNNVSFTSGTRYPASFHSTGGGDDVHVTNALIDRDGSLTGLANSIVVPKTPFNYVPGCYQDTVTNVYVCPRSSYSTGTLRINNMDTSRKSTPEFPQYERPHFFFNTTRSDGVEVHSSMPDGTLHAKVNLLLNSPYSYTVDFLGQSGHLKQFTWMAESMSTPSPVVKVIGIRDSCSVQGATKVNSVGQVNSATYSAYYRSGNTLHVKLYPTTEDFKFTEGTINIYNGVYKMNCN